jgi:hypothetical protein
MQRHLSCQNSLSINRNGPRHITLHAGTFLASSFQCGSSIALVGEIGYFRGSNSKYRKFELNINYLAGPPISHPGPLAPAWRCLKNIL